MSERRAGVLGSPIAHSLSPALHRAAYAQLGLDWAYDAYEVDGPALPGFIARLDDRWAGLSLTMPLKEGVIGLLGSVDDTARRVRSVNTVVPGERGWHGANTDIPGMEGALRRAGPIASAATCVLLGAGATARSAIPALAALGARAVRVAARRREGADEVVALAVQFGLEGAALPLDAAGPAMSAADVVVCTLPGDTAAALAPAAVAATGLLLDVSYHPWPTPLAAAWAGSGVASGRDLLLWQAVEQVRLMTGRDPDPEAMAAALEG